jgi:hypothetical protein
VKAGLGEVEGLQVNLTGADDKSLNSRTTRTPTAPVILGIPTLDQIVAHTSDVSKP